MDLSKVSSSETDFYIKPIHASRFTNEENQAVIDTKTEYAVAKAVHELIMHLYPKDVITDYHGRIRPKTQDILMITGGMSFDLFYQFSDPLAGKSYLAVDVYTRFPVNGFIIHSFAKKIECAKTGTRNHPTNYLRDKTHGIIVYRNSTKKAAPTANRLGIKFLRVSDNLRIDYKTILQEAAKNFAANRQTDQVNTS